MPLSAFEILLPHIELAAISNVDSLEHINRRSPILIFLHGYLDNANTFSTLLPYLNDYQCIAIDMAGHGKSTHRSADAHYHLVDYAYDLHVLIEQLNVQQVVLIGHSLGAIVCSIYAATKPSNLLAFIGIESCGPLSENSATTSKQLKACFISRNKASKTLRAIKDLQSVILARCASGDVSAEQAELLLSRNLKVTNEKLFWRTDKRLRTVSPMRFTEQQAKQVLSSIDCERLVILGKQGFEKVAKGIKTRKNEFVNATVVFFSGGHYVHLDSTELVAKCIKKHLFLWIK